MNPIMFHYFHDDGENYRNTQGALTSTELERIINHKDITVLDVDEWHAKLENGTLKDDETCFTFDDGIREQLDIALPVLDKYNIKANFNICSFQFLKEKDNFEIYRYFKNYYFDDIESYYKEYFSHCKSMLAEYYDEINENVDFSTYLEKSTFYTYNDRKFRYFRDEILKKDHFKILDRMIEKEKIDPEIVHSKLWISPEELKIISDSGHTIGLHTHEHPTDLCSWEYEAQLNSLKKNKEILEGIIDKEIIHCAYPCGKKNKDTYKVMSELNIEYAYAAHDFEFEQDGLNIPRCDSTNVAKHFDIK
ncbi:hypothetical protein BIT28_18855 [Photobacterium proteolyticum]|uniref:NodB homology domain-containing protein n=1 Tax=Photobacterium proteolyticum TaxID=1903952 RepID=A0A1Q9GN50_9GAMM|nr:polysaccharide deacetylase family protein [Photobacterium proteolyticum]OLQ76078.1 hypothetical protein BIT28_18855 [Photobacterium proteolyticum]